jgi:hypothetical protein
MHYTCAYDFCEPAPKQESQDEPTRRNVQHCLENSTEVSYYA